VKFASIFLVLLFVLKTSFGIAKSYWRKLHPPPPPPPNTAFGKLPAISFPKEKSQKPTDLQLETAEGHLPTDLPSVEKVYFIPQIGGRFLSLDKATSLAEKLGFTAKPKKISENIYWFDNSINNTQLKINVLTESFEYSYAYLGDQTLINPSSLPSETEAINITKTFLERIGKLTSDLKEGEYKPTYWKITTNKLVAAISPSEADFMRINIARIKIDDKYSVLPPNPNQDLVSVLISGIEIQSKNVVEVKYTHFPIDQEKFGTYPLKTIQQAWDEIKSGKYFLASFDGSQTSSVKIRKISMGYFNPPALARFLQPIFVFQGDNNFWGYVPAPPIEWSES